MSPAMDTRNQQHSRDTSTSSGGYEMPNEHISGSSSSNSSVPASPRHRLNPRATPFPMIHSGARASVSSSARHLMPERTASPPLSVSALRDDTSGASSRRSSSTLPDLELTMANGGARQYLGGVHSLLGATVHNMTTGDVSDQTISSSMPPGMLNVSPSSLLSPFAEHSTLNGAPSLTTFIDPSPTHTATSVSTSSTTNDSIVATLAVEDEAEEEVEEEEELGEDVTTSAKHILPANPELQPHELCLFDNLLLDDDNDTPVVPSMPSAPAKGINHGGKIGTANGVGNRHSKASASQPVMVSSRAPSMSSSQRRQHRSQHYSHHNGSNSRNYRAKMSNGSTNSGASTPSSTSSRDRNYSFSRNSLTNGQTSSSSSQRRHSQHFQPQGLHPLAKPHLNPALSLPNPARPSPHLPGPPPALFPHQGPIPNPAIFNHAAAAAAAAVYGAGATLLPHPSAIGGGGAFAPHHHQSRGGGFGAINPAAAGSYPLTNGFMAAPAAMQGAHHMHAAAMHTHQRSAAINAAVLLGGNPMSGRQTPRGSGRGGNGGGFGPQQGQGAALYSQPNMTSMLPQ